MVAVLLVLDGASEPLGHRPTSLELADTPVLDELASSGSLARLQTIPDGMYVGSDTAIPTLFGWAPTSRVDRARLEATGLELAIDPCDGVWRIDVVNDVGGRANELAIESACAELRVALGGYVIHRIGGHRLLIVGPRPLPFTAHRSLRLWPQGVVPPRILDEETVVVAARGAVAGVARLMGATTVVPIGATGWIDSDFAAKAEAASSAIASGARQIVVHVAAPDEAAHRLDQHAKVAVLERIDRELVGPLSAMVRATGGSLTVCPDHGCDPRTGLHAAEPVPSLTWPAHRRAGGAPRRFTERAVASLSVVPLPAREVA